MEALVGEIQPDNPPKFTGDTSPRTACGVIGTPSDNTDTLAVQAIGKSKKRLQVSGVACLVHGVAAVYAKKKEEEQGVEQTIVASHFWREAAEKLENISEGHEQFGRTQESWAKLESLL